MTIARTAVVLAMLGASTLAACSNQKPEPITASSADQSGYAERYPDALSSVRGGVNQGEGDTDRVLGAFPTFPDELDEPSWTHVSRVVELSDSAGRSSSYAARMDENNAVVAFFSEEEQDINNAVGGAVVYAAKQKNVDAEGLGGAATGALKRSVDKQLEERMREFNEAHRYIEDNQEALGKKNVEKLKSQADKISYASYTANVALPQARRDLEEMLAESGAVKSTLDRSISDASEIANDTSRAQADRAAAKRRMADAEAAKAKIDSEVEQAQVVVNELEQREKRLKEAYEKALSELKEKIDEKAAAAKNAGKAS